MTSCNRSRCYWNGQLNTGECGCGLSESMIKSTSISNEIYIQQLEDGKLNGIANADAKYIAGRLSHLAGQDRIFRLINKMVGTSK